jgi:hypothetical protein
VKFNTEPFRFGPVATKALKYAFVGGVFGTFIGTIFGAPAIGGGVGTVGGGAAGGLLQNKAEALVRKAFHFPLDEGDDAVESDNDTAKANLSRAMQQNDIASRAMMFGIAMHTYQDTWSHEGYGPYLGHAHTPVPDQAWQSPAKSKTMAKRTYDQLATLYQKTFNVAPAVTWDAIEDDVIDTLRRKGSESDIMFHWMSLFQKKIGWTGGFQNDGDNDTWSTPFLAAAKQIYAELP